jgi:hypothetical protein
LKSIFFVALFLLAIPADAQKMTYKGFPSLVWPKLYNIEYAKGQDQNGEYKRPLFTRDIRNLEGKSVTLPGYVVPFESGLKSKRFMLSSLPLNACFFCGVGGPETVIEVFTVDDVTYTDKPIQITGVLRLNDSDPDKMIYRLEQARFVGELEF